MYQKEKYISKGKVYIKGKSIYQRENIYQREKYISKGKVYIKGKSIYQREKCIYIYTQTKIPFQLQVLWFARKRGFLCETVHCM